MRTCVRTYMLLWCARAYVCACVCAHISTAQHSLSRRVQPLERAAQQPVPPACAHTGQQPPRLHPSHHSRAPSTKCTRLLSLCDLPYGPPKQSLAPPVSACAHVCTRVYMGRCGCERALCLPSNVSSSRRLKADAAAAIVAISARAHAAVAALRVPWPQIAWESQSHGSHVIKKCRRHGGRLPTFCLVPNLWRRPKNARLSKPCPHRPAMLTVTLGTLSSVNPYGSNPSVQAFIILPRPYTCPSVQHACSCACMHSCASACM